MPERGVTTWNRVGLAKGGCAVAGKPTGQQPAGVLCSPRTALLRTDVSHTRTDIKPQAQHRSTHS